MNFFLQKQENNSGKCDGVLHEVKKNDTLYKLSRFYKVSMDDLIDKNPSVDVYNLRIGDKLCIPMENRTYVTKRGDTLDELLQRYRITYEQFRKVNPLMKSFEFSENQIFFLPENAKLIEEVMSQESVDKKQAFYYN